MHTFYSCGKVKLCKDRRNCKGLVEHLEKADCKSVTEQHYTIITQYLEIILNQMGLEINEDPKKFLHLPLRSFIAHPALLVLLQVKKHKKQKQIFHVKVKIKHNTPQCGRAAYKLRICVKD